MFLKKLARKKNGKGHTYWALVESYRTTRGPRQRVVSYLGELTAGEQSGWAQLGGELGKKRAAFVQPTLFDAEAERDPVPDEVSVNVRGVRVAGAKDFGDVWLGLVLWRMLGLDELFRELLPEGREEVRWDLLATVLVLARFLAYAMWKTLQLWMERSGLGRGVRTVLAECARLKCCEVILPTSTGRELGLFCVTQPDDHQRALLDRLGIEIPLRLGRPKWRDALKLDLPCSHDF